MSAEGLRRPVALSLAVVATIATSYLLYQSYTTRREDVSQGLHRRNAVRRPRRQRAQDDLQRARNEAAEIETDPVRLDGDQPERSQYLQAALAALEAAASGNNPSGTDFGHYENEVLLGAQSAHNMSFSTALNPATLDILFDNIVTTANPLPDLQLHSLRQHIQVTFIRRVIGTFWPQDSPPNVADRIELENRLARFGIGRSLTAMTIMGALSPGTPFDVNWTRETVPHSGDDLPAADGPGDDLSSIDSPLFELEDEGAGDQGHNMLHLLYHIAEEQAKKNGYVHRGVECNSCAACPIQGIRYHCANCFDYDLCETCESKGVHIRTHVFYKIRIPAPPRGQIKQVIPKWYPGNPGAFANKLPESLENRLKRETGLDNPELQGLYDQYKCIAGHRHPSDPAKLGWAMDRKAFDMYFIPLPSDRPTPANLIYDRIFAFYDANDDGLIDFIEFVRGITRLNDKSFIARLRRLFQAFDLDGDGYVCRKDFLRMLRAHYDLSTQLNREMIARNEDMDIQDEMRETVQGTQPISSAFGGSLPHGHLSRTGEDKELGENGDLQIVNPPDGVLQEDLEMSADRYRAIGDVATGSRSRHHPFRSFRSDPVRDEQIVGVSGNNNVEVLAIQHADDASEAEVAGPDPPFHTYGWPPLLTPEPQDIISALNTDIPIEEITDPVDRSRVVYAQSERLDAESDNLDAHKRRIAINERWRRRQFYLDEEEGMQRPPGYLEPDSSDSDDSDVEEIDSPRRLSLRSRSSSKVRFDDSAIDTDYETRSNASSRSGAPNERWGGYELSRPTVDVGADILYAAVQQGFNELLDPLFKAKEDQALEAIATKPQRATWKKELDTYAANLAGKAADLNEALVQADQQRTDELLQQPQSEQADASTSSFMRQGIAESFQVNFDGAGNDISPEARRAAHAIQAQINEAINNVNAASALSRDVTPDPPRASAPKSPQPPVAASDDADLEPRDPTLPQFRPEDDDGTPPSENEKGKRANKPPPAVPSPPSADPDARQDEDEDEDLPPPPPPPSQATLARWLRHRRVEEEGRTRSGLGKLSFMEFRLLFEAMNRAERAGSGRGPGDYEGTTATNGAGGLRRPQTAEQIVNMGVDGVREPIYGNDGPESVYWERSADLGKLAFLSSWLDMAGF